MTLGGGIGSLQGLHGLLLDSLESVRLVTPIGDLIEVSETQYPELFWGLRGAGSNFGVVTSATYRTHQATHGGLVTNVDFIFAATEHASIWQALSAFDDTLPPELALTLAVAYNRTIDQVSIHQLNFLVGTDHFKSHLCWSTLYTTALRSRRWSY